MYPIALLRRAIRLFSSDGHVRSLGVGYDVACKLWRVIRKGNYMDLQRSLREGRLTLVLAGFHAVCQRSKAVHRLNVFHSTGMNEHANLDSILQSCLTQD